MIEKRNDFILEHLAFLQDGDTSIVGKSPRVKTSLIVEIKLPLV